MTEHIKIKPTRIQFLQVESPIPGIVIEGEGNLWERADSYIHLCRTVAPNDGSYHKTDFIVTFADGVTWRGRIDIQGIECPFESLRGYVCDYLAYHAGHWCPRHTTMDNYKAMLRFMHLDTPESRWPYIHWLTRYDFGFDGANAQLIV